MGGPVNFKSGATISAALLNQNNTGLQQNIKTGSGNKQQVSKTVLLQPPEDTGRGGLKIAWFEVITVEEDYLTCYPYAPQAGERRSTAVVNVAKPYLLQTAPFDGETITYFNGDEIEYTKDATDPEYKREHDDDGSAANYEITPNYYEGELITALNMPTNVSVSGTPLQWMEFCMSGRYWAR